MSKLINSFKRKNDSLQKVLSQSPASREKQTLMRDRSLLASCGYYVGRKIDSGTFATVRYAEKTSLSGTVPLAVKVIDKAKASAVYTQKFLLRELDIWPKLRHRHIIQVENILPIQDRIYVFMELAPMGSVIEYVQNNGPVPEDEARQWCKKMCQALRYCHRRGIAHRDLKCDNLLLDKNLQIKIGDFGFCCQCVNELSGNRVLSETYCGSSSYVAPEVIAAKPYDPIAADVWSAGVCVYVILNNAMPFDDTNLSRMHEDQLKRRWGFSSEVKNVLSVHAKKLMMRMLEPDVDQRPTIDSVLNSPWMRLR